MPPKQPDKTAQAPISKTGRADLDQRVRIASYDANDQTFILFAHDQVSQDVVRTYAALIHQAGASPAVVESALQLADQMEAYPNKRLVNDDHLGAIESAELRNRLKRRAWNAQGEAADPRILLAQERAMADLLGRLRPIMRVLFERGRWAEDGTFVYDPKAGPRRDGRPPETTDPDLPREPCAIAALASIEATLRAVAPTQDAA